MNTSCQCNGTPPQGNKKRIGKAANILAASLLLLMPKCAMCWAAYLGIFGLAGFSALAYRTWFLPMAMVLCSLTMGRLLWRAFYQHNYLAFLFMLVAALLIAWQKWTGSHNNVGWLAMLFMALAWVSERRIRWIGPGLRNAFR